MSRHVPSSESLWEFHSQREADTERLGSAVAAALRPGTVVGLVGNLGAGKTCLVRAIATAMGVDRRAVSSPTFVLIHEYEGRLPIYHLDTYRLRNIEEFLDLGAEEIMASRGVCLIEWADRVRDVLPDDVLWVEISTTGETSRTFRFRATGRNSTAVIQQLPERLGVDTFQDRGT